MKQHKIIAEEEIELQLLNSKRAPIDYIHVPILVQQHKHDPEFFIEIRIDGPGIYVEQTEASEYKKICFYSFCVASIFSVVLNQIWISICRIWKTIYMTLNVKAFYVKKDVTMQSHRNRWNYCWIACVILFSKSIP